MKKKKLILSAVLMTVMVFISCGGGEMIKHQEDVKEVEVTDEVSDSDNVEGYRFELLPMDKVSSGESANVSDMMNYKIVFLSGDDIIDTFEDSGDGYLSEEGDFVSIRTDVGRKQTYSYEEISDRKISIQMNFFHS